MTKYYISCKILEIQYEMKIKYNIKFRYNDIYTDIS